MSDGPSRITATYGELVATVDRAKNLRESLIGAQDRWLKRWRLRLKHCYLNETSELPQSVHDSIVDTATKREQLDDPLLPIVSDAYWLEALAVFLCDQLSLTAADVAAFRRINDARASSFKLFGGGPSVYRSVLGLLVVLVGVVAWLPKESIELIFKGHPGAFAWVRLGVVIAVLVVVVLATLASVTGKLPWQRRSHTATAVRHVLTYLEIVCVGPAAPPDPRSPAPPR